MLSEALRFIGATAAALFALASLANPQASGILAQSHVQQVYRNAAAGECKSGVNRTECVTVVAQEERDWAGIYLQTTVEVTEFVSDEAGYQFRSVNCPVDGAGLQVTPNWASLSASMDADAPECFRYGEKVTFDPPSFEPYDFTGTVTAEGNWLDPGNQFTQVANTVQTDNVTGEQQREKCRLYSGWLVLGGGFTVQGIFHPFGTADSSGDFSSNHCNIVAN